jgi:lysozyme
MMLDNDIASARLDVERALSWSRQLDPVRRDVLVHMCFNLGLPKLLGFHKFLAALRVGAYEAAAEHMLDSQWSQQVGQRAIELAEIIRNG